MIKDYAGYAREKELEAQIIELQEEIYLLKAEKAILQYCCDQYEKPKQTTTSTAYFDNEGELQLCMENLL